MSIRKRSWTTAKGEQKEAWVVDYADSSGKRRLKTFERKKEATPGGERPVTRWTKAFTRPIARASLSPKRRPSGLKPVAPVTSRPRPSTLMSSTRDCT